MSAKKLFRFFIALLFAGLFLVGCSDAPAADPDATTNSSGDGGGGEDDGGADEGQPDGGDDVEDDGTDGEEALPQLSGKSLFEFSVVGAFEDQCQTCHADPRFNPETPGPLTIYNYLYMKPKLEDGNSVDNALLRKMLGIDHTGGNQCPNGLDEPPCKYVVDWYKAEFGDDGAVAKFIEDTANADARPGHIANVTALGKVFGWAVDKNDLTKALTVKLYAGGDETTGTLVGTTTADRVGYDGNHEGNHQFLIELTDDYANGTEQELYLYATIDGTDQEMAGPIKYTAYSYSEAGRTYYQNTILPLVEQCKSCHSTTYEGHFANLISPTPAEGATADDNELVNKASGQGHGGGGRCGSGSPCNEFREWWDLEFGGL